MPSEKTLKTIVIVLGVLLVGGFAVLILMMVQRATNLGKETDETPALALPGDVIPSGMSKTKVTILRVKTPEGEVEELIFDTATGEYLGKLERDQ